MKLSDNEVWQKCKNRTRDWALRAFCQRLSRTWTGVKRASARRWKAKQAKAASARAEGAIWCDGDGRQRTTSSSGCGYRLRTPHQSLRVSAACSQSWWRRRCDRDAKKPGTRYVDADSLQANRAGRLTPFTTLERLVTVSRSFERSDRLYDSKYDTLFIRSLENQVR